MRRSNCFRFADSNRCNPSIIYTHTPIVGRTGSTVNPVPTLHVSRVTVSVVPFLSSEPGRKG